jgi:hypothetical protein
MIYRNDDIDKSTKPETMELLHQVFLKYKKVHTLGLVLEGIGVAPVWKWIVETWHKNPYYLRFGLHAWIHHNYGLQTYEEIIKDLSMCLDYWERIRGDLPKLKHFYPPNSHGSDALYQACEDLGLTCINFGSNYPSYVFHWGELTPQENAERLAGVLAGAK